MHTLNIIISINMRYMQNELERWRKHALMLWLEHASRALEGGPSGSQDIIAVSPENCKEE